MSNMEYILTQDDDCHWYVIPDDKQEAFNDWLNDENNWETPDYAESVGGSYTLVKFKEYRIE